MLERPKFKRQPLFSRRIVYRTAIEGSRAIGIEASGVGLNLQFVRETSSLVRDTHLVRRADKIVDAGQRAQRGPMIGGAGQVAQDRCEVVEQSIIVVGGGPGKMEGSAWRRDTSTTSQVVGRIP